MTPFQRNIILSQINISAEVFQSAAEPYLESIDYRNPEEAATVKGILDVFDMFNAQCEFTNQAYIHFADYFIQLATSRLFKASENVCRDEEYEDAISDMEAVVRNSQKALAALRKIVTE